MKLPSCSGSYDEWNGDYGCDTVHDVTCEDCLCLWHKTGGLWNPDTGEKLTEEQAEKLYGERLYDPIMKLL